MVFLLVTMWLILLLTCCAIFVNAAFIFHLSSPINFTMPTVWTSGLSSFFLVWLLFCIFVDWKGTKYLKLPLSNRKRLFLFVIFQINNAKITFTLWVLLKIIITIMDTFWLLGLVFVLPPCNISWCWILISFS